MIECKKVHNCYTLRIDRGGRNMNDRNLKLIYIALGSLMLILLQSDVFQLAISLINILPIPYLTETIYWLMRILSFVGVVIFIIISLIFLSLFS